MAMHKHANARHTLPMSIQYPHMLIGTQRDILFSDGDIKVLSGGSMTKSWAFVEPKLVADEWLLTALTDDQIFVFKGRWPNNGHAGNRKKRHESPAQKCPCGGSLST